MKTDKRLKELIENLKNTPPEIPAGTVKSLIDSGKPSPFVAKRSFQPRRIKQFFNPLKILIMIAPIVIITSALLIWNPGSRKELLSPASQDPKIEQIEPNSIQETKQIKNLNNESGTNLENKESPTEARLSKAGLVPNQPASEMDTTLRGVILELTNEELARLGFRFTPKGFMFLNRMGDGRYLSFISLKDKYTTHLYLDVKKDVHYLIEKDITSLDFYPEAISNQQGNLIHDIATKRIKDQKGYIEDELQTLWEHINDTLIPVRINSSITGGYDANPFLLWFRASESFFSIIGPEKAGESQKIWRAAKETSLTGGLMNHVIFTYQPYNEPENLLVLSPEVFRCFGFNFENGDCSFDSYINRAWIRFSPYSGVKSFMRAQIISHPDFSAISTPVLSMYPKMNERVYINNINLVYELRREDSVDGVPFMDALELCIPVKIGDPTLHQHVQDCIFWIYPNDRFLGCLPKEIGEPMRKERNYQLKRMDPNFVTKIDGRISIGASESKKGSVNEAIEPVPCVYFSNLCESLPGLDYVNLFPNPATDKLNIDLVLVKAKKIRFRVIDLGGRVITDYGSPENFNEGGQYKHQIDISNLQSGLYVLVMTDEEGAKLTKRFVKN